MAGTHFICLIAAVVLGAVGAPPESPLQQVLKFLPAKVPAGGCRDALYQYLHSLERENDWAVSLYDSSTKYPDGLLTSNGYSLGHFDQCLGARTESFSGKYCLVNVYYSRTNYTHPVMRGSRFKLQRNEAHLALCIPSLCNTNDLEPALQEAHHLFPYLDDVYIRVRLNENQCSVLEEEPNYKKVPKNNWLRFGIITLAAAYCLNLFLPIISSRELKKKTEIVSCFSVSRHWKKLMSPNLGVDSIGCVHGLRVIALSIVIVGHRAEAIASSPLLNPEYIEKMFESPFNIIVLNGTVFVDTFFTISGFLLCWKILKMVERGSDLSFWKIIRQRYFRLTPCYALVILFQASVMERLGSGPLWKLKVGQEAANCRKNWWTNLFYINNYWDPQHICIDPSWYLACDMQLLLLGTMVIYPLIHWKRYRVVPFLLAITAAFSIPYYVTYSNGLDPTVIPDLATVGQTSKNKTNLLLYITAYCRAGPYLVGIASAFLLARLEKTQKWPPELFWSIGWYLSAGCMLGSITLGYPFFTLTKVHPVLTALYASSFRTVFSLGVSFIIIAGACGKGVGFLSATPLLPLSRISYSVYLTHTLWIQLSYAWIQSPLHSTDLFQACLILSDLTACTLVGILTYLLVECPAADLCLLWNRRNL